MSVSFGPYTSSATMTIPICGASSFMSSRPPAPYPSEAERIAIFEIPAFFACWKIFFTARMSLGTTLNTYGRTGWTIFFAAAHDTSGTFASSTFGMIARVFPEVLGPMMATTLSFLISRSTAVTAFVASVSSSYTMISTFLPRSPPDLLMSSSSIFAVLRSGSPRNDAGPVTEKIAPIRIGSSARTTPPDSKIASRMPRIQPFFPVIFFSSRSLFPPIPRFLRQIRKIRHRGEPCRHRPAGDWRRDTITTG